ncbi:hypothetical protein PHYPSEUDO_006019 [Phytophthora pseudosyringae]|uniref:Uncharacterized protein n=1 Tax=Phytophthora pseudosyringae TaxID=221518 RepID=A0A8T1VK17_9STRA|nr:hypothetical protein PHYPSEUDO_006019 [Phytophthora pseudosyringae]
MHIFKLHAVNGQRYDGIVSDSGLYVLQRRELTSEDALDDITAISYAWGSLPHRVAETWEDHESGETLFLMLGPEWDSTSLLDELVALSAGSWLWQDQFSLSQRGVTTNELSMSIPAVYKSVCVLVLLPGSACEKRERTMQITRGSCTAVERLMNHSQKCGCIGGIDMWLKRVWPWQEVAYAKRLKLKLAGGGGRGSLPKDTMTLLRQQILDKCVEEGVNNNLGVDWAFGSDRVGGHQVFMELIRGNEAAFGSFTVPTGPQILQYMSDYVEQCRICTKESDLVSAVAPAIGATAVAGCSLSDGIKAMIDYIKRATGSAYVGPLPQGMAISGGSSYLADEFTFSSLQSVSVLHGSHFAIGYTEGEDLPVDVDYALHIEPFPEPEDHRTHRLGHLLNSMSLGQRRMLVRWLNTWEPAKPTVRSDVADDMVTHGIFDAVFSHLKKFVQTVDVTSSVQGSFHTAPTVQASPNQWTQLVMILLRVIEYGVPSDLEAKLAIFCQLVTVEGPGNTRALGYVGVNLKTAPTVVAAGNCLMLAHCRDVASEIAELHKTWPMSSIGMMHGTTQVQLPSGPSPSFHVLGRLPFVDRASINFESRFVGRLRPDNPMERKIHFPGKYVVSKVENYTQAT